MAQGDINDPLTNIPDIVVVDQSSGAAAPGEGYARLGVINGVLSVRIGTGEWTPIAAGLDGPTLHALTLKETPVDADELFIADSEDSWAAKRATRGNVKGETGAGGLYASYACVSDRKSQGTGGGAITINTWTARVLNTEDADPDSIVALASNQLTFTPGTYRALIVAPFQQCGQATLRLYNTTGAVELLRTGATYMTAAEGDATQVVLQGRFTVAADQALEIQYRAHSNPGVFGLGGAVSQGGETYTVAEFWQEA